MPDPGQQQDENHRGQQEPEETQNIEAQGEEAAEVRVEKKVISEAIKILLSHPIDL
jgi:hypothetical protein